MSAPVVGLPSIFARSDQRLAAPAHEEMVVERLRIAFGVNDTVIRHLFSIGLTLHTTRTMVSDLVQVRLDATIDELDGVISELRSLVFDLQCGTPGGCGSAT